MKSLYEIWVEAKSSVIPEGGLEQALNSFRQDVLPMLQKEQVVSDEQHEYALTSKAKGILASFGSYGETMEQAIRDALNPEGGMIHSTMKKILNTERVEAWGFILGCIDTIVGKYRTRTN